MLIKFIKGENNLHMSEVSNFSSTILNQKYAMTKEDETKETWEEICHRVCINVFKSVGLKKNSPLVKEAINSMINKKWCPGGRYLYASGRPYHQTQNCLLLRAKDSREGWAELMHNATLALMTGAGIGVVYSDVRPEGKLIRKTGGTSTGPLALMQMVNETGRGIMQGGSRRSAIWAGLNWNHSDIFKFIHVKDWSKEVINLKSKNFNFPAPLDGTNISVLLDDLFFEAYHDEKHILNSHAQSVYWAVIENMLKTGEPGFSIDVGKNKGEELRNACVSGNTTVDIILNGETQKVDIKTLLAYFEDGNNEILVKSFNEKTNKEEYKEIYNACLTRKNAKVLKIEDEETNKHIICTPDHLILTKNRGYVRADELVRIDQLITFFKGRCAMGLKITEVIEEIDVYDISVKDNHNFYANDIVVHNCTEISSSDDSDICNLGSINLANINSLEEMASITEISTAFLLAGTVYSDVPYAKVDMIRTKNRRIGLGLMGIHEWLLKRGKGYGPDPELEQYLKIYENNSEIAKKYAQEWEISAPIKCRAIAPNGTIGIVMETTTGIEPIFCVAYKRRYLKGDVWNYQYVIDPTAQRLINLGLNPNHIEDAYTLSLTPEKRVEFQAWLQKFVDHGISSTINLPHWGSEINNSDKIQSFGKMLIKHLPNLRGITAFPDGGRGGVQPLNPVNYNTAIKHLGEVFVEGGLDVCSLTKGGSCGE